MKLDDFINNTGQWLKGKGAFSNIVMSSRIRLARNLVQQPFPNKARKKDLYDVLTAVQNATENIDFFKKSIFLKINELDNVDLAPPDRQRLESGRSARRVDQPAGQRGAGAHGAGAVSRLLPVFCYRRQTQIYL